MDIWATITLTMTGGTILLAALAECIRGGWLGWLIPGGTAGARLVRALVWAMISAAWALESWVAVATLVGAFLALLNSHRDSWDIGFDHGSPWVDALVMTADLVLWWLWDTAGLLSLAVSLMHPAVYRLACRFKPSRPNWASSMLASPTAYAELAWGAAQGLVLALVLAA
jgi:hypothetical protein